MINVDRLKEIRKLSLSVGSHASPQKKMCVMEAVAYVAGEPWSDQPTCTCPILTSYAIRTNDTVDDETRALLKPLIKKLVGTRLNKASEKARAEYFAHHSFSVILPILTDALKLKAVSARLRSFKMGEWLAARDYINSVRGDIKEAARKHAAAYAAADAASYAAAATAAYAAAYAAANASYAATAADAAAKTAPTTAKSKKTAARWTKVKKVIWEARVKALSKACLIKEKV